MGEERLKPMSDEDAFGGDLFDSFQDKIKPGTKVSGVVGRLRYRQGNDVRDWSGAGNAKYLPGVYYSTEL